MVDIIPSSQLVIGHGAFSIVYRAKLKSVSSRKHSTWFLVGGLCYPHHNFCCHYQRLCWCIQRPWADLIICAQLFRKQNGESAGTAVDVDVICLLLLCFCSHSRRCWCYSPTLTFCCQRATTMQTAITNGFSNFSRFPKQQTFVPYFRDFPNNRSSFHICASCSRSREWAFREVVEE